MKYIKGLPGFLGNWSPVKMAVFRGKHWSAEQWNGDRLNVFQDNKNLVFGSDFRGKLVA